MKLLKIIGICILLATLGTACKKDSTTAPSPVTSTSTDPIAGTWRVSSFMKDSVDLTGQFSGYTFTCNSNGGLTIAGHGNTYNCNWNWSDANHSMCHFHISGCDDNSILWECEGDWNLISHDSLNCHFKTHNPHHNSTMTWTLE